LSFPKNQILQPRDTSDVILQIRKRLFITGDLIIDSRQKTFDNELLEGVLKYKKRNGFTPDSLLLQHIENMNITVHERIKTIMVNMERSR
jgi:murein L,D-transpeptidase YcbB/YkuD